MSNLYPVRVRETKKEKRLDRHFWVGFNHKLGDLLMILTLLGAPVGLWFAM